MPAAAAVRKQDAPQVDLKKQILDRVGDLSEFEIARREVLVAIYMRPEMTPGGIVLPQQNLKEDLFQAKAHLVLKLGPGCEFPDLDIKLHDWVVLRPSDAWSLDVNMRPDVLERKDFVPCRMVFDDQIRARIQHPGMVW